MTVKKDAMVLDFLMIKKKEKLMAVTSETDSSFVGGISLILITGIKF